MFKILSRVVTFTLVSSLIADPVTASVYLPANQPTVMLHSFIDHSVYEKEALQLDGLSERSPLLSTGAHAAAAVDRGEADPWRALHHTRTSWLSHPGNSATGLDPAIALVAGSEGKWQKYDLTKDQHEALNKAWGALWNPQIDLSKQNEIYKDVFTELKDVITDYPLHIQAPSWKRIKAELDRSGVAFPEGFRLATHPGTYRDANHPRSVNLLIPWEMLNYLTYLRQNTPQAYKEWLDHEVAHLKNQLANRKGQGLIEKSITDQFPTTALESAYTHYLQTQREAEEEFQRAANERVRKFKVVVLSGIALLLLPSNFLLLWAYLPVVYPQMASGLFDNLQLLIQDPMRSPLLIPAVLAVFFATGAGAFLALLGLTPEPRPLRRPRGATWWGWPFLLAVLPLAQIITHELGHWIPCVLMQGPTTVFLGKVDNLWQFPQRVVQIPLSDFLHNVLRHPWLALANTSGQNKPIGSFTWIGRLSGPRLVEYVTNAGGSVFAATIDALALFGVTRAFSRSRPTASTRTSLRRAFEMIRWIVPASLALTGLLEELRTAFSRPSDWANIASYFQISLQQSVMLFIASTASTLLIIGLALWLMRRLLRLSRAGASATAPISLKDKWPWIAVTVAAVMPALFYVSIPLIGKATDWLYGTSPLYTVIVSAVVGALMSMVYSSGSRLDSVAGSQDHRRKDRALPQCFHHFGRVSA